MPSYVFIAGRPKCLELVLLLITTPSYKKNLGVTVGPMCGRGEDPTMLKLNRGLYLGGVYHGSLPSQRYMNYNLNSPYPP